MLTLQQRSRFHSQGYVILENYVSSGECDTLIRRMERMTGEFASLPVHTTVFSTKTHQHQRDQYFLDSADKIHYFLEEGAVDEQGRLNRPFHRAVNKVGHSLHKDDPVFREFCQQTKIACLAENLDFQEDPFPVQSMYIFKQPKIGGEVRPHQDSTFIHTTPDRVLGMWLALEDAGLENGCLRGLPGPDWTGTSTPACRFRREGNSCSFEGPPEGPWKASDFIPLEVKKGCLILFSGLFPHMSSENNSDKTRHAFTLHFIDRSCHYEESNWIRRGSLGLSPGSTKADQGDSLVTERNFPGPRSSS